MEKFKGSFPKLSKSNSFTIYDIVIYHKKEKGIRVYYDYVTKYKLGFSCEDSCIGLNHEEFVKFLEDRKDELQNLHK